MKNDDTSIDDSRRVRIEVAPLADLVKQRRIVIEHEGHPVLVLHHEGAVYAFDNICIHRKRELVKGAILNGKLVCPGHQWAFELGTGYESVKQECQPTHPVLIDDGRVFVDVRLPDPDGEAAPGTD